MLISVHHRAGDSKGAAAEQKEQSTHSKSLSASSDGVQGKREKALSYSIAKCKRQDGVPIKLHFSDCIGTRGIVPHITLQWGLAEGSHVHCTRLQEKGSFHISCFSDWHV